MWMFAAAVLTGAFFGRVQRDCLSALFLAVCAVTALRALVTSSPASLSMTPAGRRVLDLLSQGEVMPLSGMLILAVSMTLLTHLLTREPDRLRDWDDIGPRRRRRRAHA